MKTKPQHIGLNLLTVLTAFDDHGIERAQGNWLQVTGQPLPKGTRP